VSLPKAIVDQILAEMDRRQRHRHDSREGCRGINTDMQIVSRVPMLPPFKVRSRALVRNLNVELLQGRMAQQIIDDTPIHDMITKHSKSGLTPGQFLRATGATAFDFEAVPFSVAGVVLNPSAAINVIAWRAPFICTVTAVKGYRVGGTGATINARKNGASNHLASDLSLTSADTWMDGGSVQNTDYAAGDKLEIMLVSISGTPTQIAIQVEFTRP